ncbi:conserved membrane hypothetical protein [Candidatus Sulfotelmatomonas gaucii]|uniref:DUF2231 domain-containing protein n=1 Tax=Candidatus Sulfuritelmatomonas gaucii TaxID=2043161 RepID=A0A2N9M2Z3_9BACT|nr:conserved membrane hypothetical protein [Candidatus Sulfotelmatomonas gaucii]
MPQFPPIPTWDSLHPLVIHFPIVLLLLSPLFILISAVLSPPKGRPYMTGALIILLLGTISLFVASATGQAAAKLADRGGPVDAILAAHEDLAFETEIVFSALSVVLVGMVVLPRIFCYPDTRLTTTFLPLAFLVLCSAGILFVVNTAHEGGRLVHEFGVHAMVPAGSGQSHPLPAARDHSAQMAKEK